MFDVPDGFNVSLYANDELAHDIHCMTVDSLGRIVVSGVGYTRILVDRDGDGRADEFRQFADGPRSGAQGLYFHGRDLIAVGDAGLIRFRDRDADDRADGPPEVFLRFSTGSEHHAHAIRRGPDGWWYLIAGNYSGIDAKYVTLKTSPIVRPESGILLRLKPDLTGGEIFADGYRNAYDFDFHGSGDLFTFDSDGERDVSLPWYRPTRVFQMLPGSHAGWISRSWKRPDYFFDMAPVLGDFGRGSPTGVAVYRHDQFPTQYHDAVFVLDWTFGRVFALPTSRQNSTWKSQPIEFMTAKGQAGFAPTDVAVGPDGSLFVCVGGRGTRGSVYRISYQGDSAIPIQSDSDAESQEDVEPSQQLTHVLDAKQPLSSWSRSAWIPLAQSLGQDKLVAAVKNQELSVRQRVRAIEILVEVFAGVDSGLIRTADMNQPALVLGRLIWAYGRTRLDEVDLSLFGRFVTHEDPFVARMALQALLSVPAGSDWTEISSALLMSAGSEDRYVRQMVSRVIGRWPEALIVKTLNAANGQPLSMLTIGFALIGRGEKAHAGARMIALVLLESGQPAAVKRDAVRLLQLALGDVGPGEHAATFDSYWARVDLSSIERELDPLRSRLAELYPSGDTILDREMTRVIAMLTPFNRPLMERVMSRMSEDSDPVDDLHHLHVLARLPIEKGLAQSEQIAELLVGLEGKIRDREMKIDSNWEERVRELYAELVKTCPALPAQIVRLPGFGQPEHVLFLSEIGEEDLQTAVSAFVLKAGEPDYRWTNDVVFVIGESSDPAHRELIRQLYGNSSVREAVLMVLSSDPEEQDRGRFIQGLESVSLDGLENVLSALMSLPANQSPEQAVALVKTLRRLGTDRKEYMVREQVMQQLRRDWSESRGFEFGKSGFRPQPKVIAAWSDWLMKQFPNQAASDPGNGEFEQYEEQFGRINWNDGDLNRGKAVYEARSCSRCHGGRRALGPDLAGVSRRFSRPDILAAMVDPNRDVSPRYRTTVVETTEGRVFTGLIVYQSVDGLILRNATNQTFRIEAEEIEDRRTLTHSLMPVGLLKDITDRDLADLFAYLDSLSD